MFAAPLRHVPGHLIGGAAGLMDVGGPIGGVIAPRAAALLAAHGGSSAGSFGLFPARAAPSALVSLARHRARQAAGLADV